jgi:hypothetical protein
MCFLGVVCIGSKNKIRLEERPYMQRQEETYLANLVNPNQISAYIYWIINSERLNALSNNSNGNMTQ